MKIYSITPINNVYPKQLTHNDNSVSQYSRANNNLSVCYPSNYYLSSPIAFGAKNVELITQMEKAIGLNKSEEVNKLFEQMTEIAQRNVKGLVEKFKLEGLTLKDYIPACVKQPS